jgi:hypothetical protein
VAEQVEKVNPDRVSRDEHGKPYTVRYEAVNAMLLNEFLKEHRTVQELKSTVAKQDAAIAQQQSANADSAEGNCGSHGSPQSAGRANPEGERPVRQASVSSTGSG